MMAQHQQLSGNHQHVQNELSALLQHNHTDHSHTHQQQQQVHDLTLQVTQLTNQSHAWKEQSQALHNDHHHQKELVRRLRHQVEVHREENDGLVAAVARVEAREEQVRAQLSENVVVLAVAVRKREDAMVVVQEQRLVASALEEEVEALKALVRQQQYNGARWVRFFVFLLFCFFVFLALCIDLLTDKVQPLSRKRTTNRCCSNRCSVRRRKCPRCDKMS